MRTSSAATGALVLVALPLSAVFGWVFCSGRTGNGAMATTAGWVDVGALVVDVVGGAECSAEWQPPSTAPSSTMPASPVPATALATALLSLRGINLGPSKIAPGQV